MDMKWIAVMMLGFCAAVAVGVWSESQRSPEQLCASRSYQSEFCAALVEKMKRETK